MNLENLLIDLWLKIKQNKWPFILAFIVWLTGFIYYYKDPVDLGIENIILITLGIRSPLVESDFSQAYQIIWSILLEVIVFGFLITALLERYNPVVTSKIMAKNRKNHTVVIGMFHVGDRIVEYLIEHKKKYTILHEDKEDVEDLLKIGAPIVVGNITDDENLEFAGVKKAKEVFICTNDAKDTIIICEKVRRLNKSCHIYARLYNDQFRQYLHKAPLFAYTFSTSEWAMQSVKSWTSHGNKAAIVLGRDHLAQKITEFLAHEKRRKVYILDPKIDESLYDEEELIETHHDNFDRLRYIQDYVNLNDVSQVFICWKEEEEFNDSIYLVTQFRKKYPSIKLYVRIFDEDLDKVLKNLKADTFSTSEFAFKRLQQEVDHKSNIYKTQ